MGPVQQMQALLQERQLVRLWWQLVAVLQQLPVLHPVRPLPMGQPQMGLRRRQPVQRPVQYWHLVGVSQKRWHRQCRLHSHMGPASRLRPWQLVQQQEQQ